MTNPIEYAELHSPDPKQAGGFYASLLGWTTDAIETPGGTYTRIGTGAGIGAGLMQAPFKGAPTAWTIYVTVPRLSEAVTRATSLGARVEVPASTVPDVGTFALLRDPTGAVFGLFEKLAAAR